MTDFGKWVKSVRKEKHITQLDLATDVGITDVSMSNIETGKKDPSYITMIAILDSLGYELDFKKKGA